MANNRWYPSPSESGSHDAWNIHTQILNHVYATQDRLDKLGAQAKGEAAAPSAAPPATSPGSPSHTQIAGLTVAGTVPQNGQKLTYNASTGQIEWQ